MYFQSVVKHYRQLWSIRGFIKGRFVSLVFVLMIKDKPTANGYIEIIESINLTAINTKLVLTDFERAEIKALKHCFPNASVRLSHF